MAKEALCLFKGAAAAGALDRKRRQSSGFGRWWVKHEWAPLVAGKWCGGWPAAARQLLCGAPRRAFAGYSRGCLATLRPQCVGGPGATKR